MKMKSILRNCRFHIIRYVSTIPSSHSSTCGAGEHLLLLGIIDAVRETKETVVKLELIKTLVMDGKVVHFKLHSVLGIDEIASQCPCSS